MEKLNRDRLATLQGAFYAASGIWPIVHLRSFEAVTGVKREPWLVKTVGALITVVGVSLASAGRRRRVTPEIELLGAGSAAAFAVIDFFYAGIRGRIARSYLLDGVAELAMLGAWAANRAGSARRLTKPTSAMPVGWAQQPAHA